MIKSLRAAAKYAGVSHSTIRNWHLQYNIGHFAGRTYFVHEWELAPFIEAYKLRTGLDQQLAALKKSPPVVEPKG